MMSMSRIRLRLRRGYRVDVVEVPTADVLLGSDPTCGVVVEGTAAQHAWLLPRRGRLLLAPVAHTPRRPAVDGQRIEAPVVLGAEQTFQLADVAVVAQTASGPAGLEGQQIGPWYGEREVGGALLPQRFFVARSGSTEARLAQISSGDAENWQAWLESQTTVYRADGALVWVESGPAAISLQTMLAAHRHRALRWPIEAAVVVMTQLAEALCDYHDRWGVHGALRPELVYVDIDGRLSLPLAAPCGIDLSYQPESVRLGAAPDRNTDLYGWWRLAHRVLAGFGLRRLRRALPTPPRDRGALLAAAEGVRRWSVEQGFDPTAVHVARGVGLAVRQPRVGRPGQTLDAKGDERG